MKLSDLAPSREHFLSEIWQQSPHLQRGAVAEAGSILSVRDIDKLLAEGGLRQPCVQVVRDGRELGADLHTFGVTEGTSGVTGLYDVAALTAEVGGGASLTLRGLEHMWLPIRRSCRELEIELCHPVQANAYLTPPRSSGYPLHHDIHDVFVLQTVGSKEWEVRLPGAEGDDQSGSRRFRMDSGDCLYLPRGWPHRAWTTDTTSVHVTFGVRAKTYADAVLALMTDAAPPHPATLPVGYANDRGTLAHELRQRLLALAALVQEAGVVDRVVDALWDRRRPPLEGHLHDVLALPALSADDQIFWRTDHLCAVREGGDTITLSLWDRTVEVPLQCRAALEQLRDGAVTKVGTLTGLPESEALALARRLVQAGIVRLA